MSVNIAHERRESPSARRARLDGWLPIDETPTKAHYISRLEALNLYCPYSRTVADWHTSMWRAGDDAIDRRKIRVRTGPWRTTPILGHEGIYDARASLRRTWPRWVIAGFGIGGHPQGYALKPVYAAAHARAILDMLLEDLFLVPDAIPHDIVIDGLPHPFESAGWLRDHAQIHWMLGMAARIARTLPRPFARIVEAWQRHIVDIPKDSRAITKEVMWGKWYSPQ